MNKDIFCFDIHGHKEGLLPFAWRLASFFRMPPDVPLGRMKALGVNGGVVCAIGDPGSFKRTPQDSFTLVKRQIEAIRGTLEEAGGRIALTSGDMREAYCERGSVFVLGIEGGDFIENDLSRIDEVYGLGVRVLLPVHYAKNLLGSISYGWKGKIVPESEQSGLTPLGRAAVEKACGLGMILDFSHADERTLFDALKVSRAPLISSHTGPRALQDFPRYTSDEGIQGVAESGGLIGLWPFRTGGLGMGDIDDFIACAARLRETAGADHVAIGSDFNGVPGYMKGYTGPADWDVLIGALRNAGFSDAEIARAAGLNFIEVFAGVEAAVRL